MVFPEDDFLLPLGIRSLSFRGEVRETSRKYLASWWLNQPLLKNMSQIGSFPQVEVKITKIFELPPVSLKAARNFRNFTKAHHIQMGTSSLETLHARRVHSHTPVRGEAQHLASP